MVPITFIVIEPTDQQLLAAVRDLGSAETRQLLERWGTLLSTFVLAQLQQYSCLWGIFAA